MKALHCFRVLQTSRNERLTEFKIVVLINEQAPQSVSHDSDISIRQSVAKESAKRHESHHWSHLFTMYSSVVTG
jgi:hypothetical protein